MVLGTYIIIYFRTRKKMTNINIYLTWSSKKIVYMTTLRCTHWPIDMNSNKMDSLYCPSNIVDYKDSDLDKEIEQINLTNDIPLL